LHAGVFASDALPDAAYSDQDLPDIMPLDRAAPAFQRCDREVLRLIDDRHLHEMGAVMGTSASVISFVVAIRNEAPSLCGGLWPAHIASTVTLAPIPVIAPGAAIFLIVLGLSLSGDAP
jgi:hypothetical protein